MEYITIHTVSPCSWNKRVSWWNHGVFSYHALLLLLAVVSCYADPQDIPICYEALRKGPTLTTFKRTEYRDGKKAYRFESAFDFSISELLTDMNHDHTYDNDKPSNVITSTLRDTSPPTTRLLDVTHTKRTEETETTKLSAPTVKSTSPYRLDTPAMTRTYGYESTTSIKSVQATSSTPNATFHSEVTQSHYVFDIISENNTNVTSPNFPSHYENSMSYWVSIRPPNRLSRVNLTFISFDVEYSPNCAADSLLILGTGDPNPILCGSTIPSPVVSLGNIMELYFKTDSKTTSTGFEAVIQFLYPDPDYRTPGPGICGSIFVQANSTINLKSPNDGNSHYRNIRCGYNIHADVGKVITLSFHWIDLEACVDRDENYDPSSEFSSHDIPDVILGVNQDIDVESCFCDSLQIFDGFDANAPKLTDRLCSSEVPDFTPISTGNVMYIYLETDDVVRRPGFSVYLSVP